MKRENHQFAMIANVVIIGNVAFAVQNASRITENVLIPIAIRWIYRRDRMDKLKPCPFCGCGEGNLYIVTFEQHGFDTVGIFCNGCKQTVTLEYNEWEGLNDKTKEKAIEAWNRREG